MSETRRWCAGCTAETWFEVVVLEDCTEDELGCIDCGAAVIVGVLVPGLLDLVEDVTWSVAPAPMAA